MYGYIKYIKKSTQYNTETSRRVSKSYLYSLLKSHTSPRGSYGGVKCIHPSRHGAVISN